MLFRRQSILAIAILLAIAGSAAAHAPQFAGENDSLDTALEITDTDKSWAIYGHLHQGEAKYYTFEIDEGDRLLLDLIVPVKDGDDGFLPSMVLLVPGSDDHDPLPSWVDVPDGYGHMVVDTSMPNEATYEGFTPSAFYDLGRTDGPAPAGGRYYVAIYAPPYQEGNFALVVGYEESFTLEELVLIPFSLYTIYVWEGQEPWQVLTPMVTTVALGTIAILFYRHRRPEPMDLQSVLLLTGGLLVLGTATSTLVQTFLAVSDSHLGLEVLISVLLFTAPGVIGLLVLRRGWDTRPFEGGDRMKMFILGVISIFIWAGYLVGPALMIVSSVLPRGAAKWPNRQKAPRRS